MTGSESCISKSRSIVCQRSLPKGGDPLKDVDVKRIVDADGSAATSWHGPNDTLSAPRRLELCAS